MEYEDRPYQSECLESLGASGAHRNLWLHVNSCSTLCKHRSAAKL